jgi:flavin reductase (DIM6/NTAB) family NADH-FMN oxidoreductase RutF
MVVLLKYQNGKIILILILPLIVVVSNKTNKSLNKIEKRDNFVVNIN